MYNKLNWLIIKGTVLGTALEIEALNETESHQSYGVVFSVYTNRWTPVDSVVTYTDYNSDYQDVVDLARGVFTTKTAGSYLLNFHSKSGKATGGREMSAQLCVNGIVRAASYSQRSGEQKAAIIISAVLNLQRGDRVHVFVTGASLISNNAEDGTHYTQFSGVKLG